MRLHLNRETVVKRCKVMVDITIMLLSSLWFDLAGPMIATRCSSEIDLITILNSMPPMLLSLYTPIIVGSINTFTLANIFKSSINYIQTIVKYRLPLALVMYLFGSYQMAKLYLLLALSGGAQILVYGTVIKVFVLDRLVQDLTALRPPPVAPNFDAVFMNVFTNMIPPARPRPRHAPRRAATDITVSDEPPIQIQNSPDSVDIIDHQHYNTGDNVYILNGDVRHIVRENHMEDLIRTGNGVHPLTREPITSIRRGVIVDDDTDRPSPSLSTSPASEEVQ